jgi:hypothetical protein
MSNPQEVAYYVVSGQSKTTPDEMARVAGVHWAVEESFKTAKGEVGLHHYEVRSWAGCMLGGPVCIAHCCAVIRRCLSCITMDNT